MQSIDAAIVLAQYLEPIVRGRRVAVLGDTTRALPQGLLERGARLVHAYDPDAPRAAVAAAQAEKSRSLVIAPLPTGDLPVRDGAFDTVIVPDLTEFDDPDALVARVARLVASHGAAVFATPNVEAEAKEGGDTRRPEALSYYQLYDTVSLRFAHVRMIGQAPFVGHVVADFAPAQDDIDVVVDTSLLERGAEEPTWFVALASAGRPVQMDPYTIVQIPQGCVAPRGPAAASLTERIQALENEIVQNREALSKSESRAGDEHVRAGRLEQKVRELEEDLRRQRERGFLLSTEIEEEKKAKTKAELELGMLRRKGELSASDLATRARATQLEQRVSDLEQQLTTRDLRIAQLQRDLSNHQTETSNLASDLERARREAAQIKATHAQSQKRIADLEHQLSDRDERVATLEKNHAESLEKLTSELAQARQQGMVAVAEANQLLRDQEAEVDALERRITDLGRERASMQEDLRNREGLVRELVVMLQSGEDWTACEAGGQPRNEDLRAVVDRLAVHAAQRQADLEAARWKVVELESKLAQCQSPASEAAQIDELRQALLAAQQQLHDLRQQADRRGDHRVSSGSPSEP